MTLDMSKGSVRACRVLMVKFYVAYIDRHLGICRVVGLTWGRNKLIITSSSDILLESHDTSRWS